MEAVEAVTIEFGEARAPTAATASPGPVPHVGRLLNASQARPVLRGRRARACNASFDDGPARPVYAEVAPLLVGEVIAVKPLGVVAQGGENGAPPARELAAVSQEPQLLSLRPPQEGVEVVRRVARLRLTLLEAGGRLPRAPGAWVRCVGQAHPRLMPISRRPGSLGLPLKRRVPLVARGLPRASTRP